MRIKTNLFLTVSMLAGVFILFELSNIDLIVEDSFYDIFKHSWLLSRQKDAWTGIIFYSGLKLSIIVFGLMVLTLYLNSFRASSTVLKPYRKGLLLVWLSLIFVPAIIGELKTVTNMPCPCEVVRYGGNYPYFKLFDTAPDLLERFRCFPAGHASGGFALMSLFFLFKSTINRVRSLVFALLTGWSMGLYKMLIGDHYLSHTIISMLLAWLIILIIHLLINNRYHPLFNSSKLLRQKA